MKSLLTRCGSGRGGCTHACNITLLLLLPSELSAEPRTTWKSKVNSYRHPKWIHQRENLQTQLSPLSSPVSTSETRGQGALEAACHTIKWRFWSNDLEVKFCEQILRLSVCSCARVWSKRAHNFISAYISVRIGVDTDSVTYHSGFSFLL